MRITLVGNISFLKKFEEAKEILEQQKHEVIIPEKESMLEPTPQSVKRKAMDKFNENLKKSDAILVMNYSKKGEKDYIGANTLMEVGMAFIFKKKIFVLNSSPEFCKDELRAIEVQFLNGNLSNVR